MLNQYENEQFERGRQNRENKIQAFVKIRTFT